MKKKSEKIQDPAELRKLAEQQLVFRSDALINDEKRLLHELQVHQIELELQNEALQNALIQADEARSAAELAQERYTELFDFAPMAYFILDADDVIQKTNFSGAKLLGIERSKLSGQKFIHHVSPEDRPSFNRFLEEVFSNKNKRTCEIKLQTGETPCYIAIEATVNKTQNTCLMTALDISERKQHEEYQRESNAFITSILNSLTTQIAVLDTQGVIIAVNNAWIEFGKENGLTEASHNMLGVNYLDACKTKVDHFLCDEAETAYTGISGILAGGQQSFTLEYPCHSAYEQRWFRMTASPLKGTHYGAVVSHENITQRKVAERIAEQRHLDILEDQTEFICCFKADGTLLYVNQAFCKLFGKSSESLMGKTWNPIALSEDVPLIQEKLNSLSPSNPVVTIENRIVTAGGVIRWGQFVNRAFFDENGVICEMQSVGRDITEQKQAEVAIQLENRKIKGLLSTASDGIHILDEAGNIIEFSDSFAEMLGYSHEETARLNVVDWEAQIPKDQLGDFVKGLIAQARKFETKHRRKDGIILDVEINSNSVEIDGKHYLYASSRDITERKQMEEALRVAQKQIDLAMEFGEIGVWDLDLIHDTAWRSLEHDRIFGYESPPPEWGFEICLQHVVPLDRAVFSQAFEEAFLTGKLFFECRIIRPDQSLHWITARGRVLFDEKAKPMRMLGIVADITERKRVELEREQYFRFFHLSMDSMCIADPYGCFKQVNPRFMQLTGYEETELLAKPFLDFILPEDRQKTLDEMKQQVAGRPSMQFENRYVCKDGRVMLLSWSAYFDKSASVTYATAHDITDLRQAEEALRNSEQLFRTLAEAEPQIVWMTRPDGWNIYFNQHWVDYTGLTLEESYGHGWNTPFHPDDQKPAWDAWTLATQADEAYSLECRLRRKDGVYRWWLIRGVSLHYEVGNIVNWIGTCTDIEEIKQAEQKLKFAASVFTHAREGIMITADDGTIIDINEAFCLITGYCREEVLGNKPSLLKSGRHDKEFYAALWRSLIEKDHWYGEIWNRRKNGGVFPMIETISAMYDTLNNTRQYVALFSDITRLKEHELQLQHIAHFDALTSLPNRVLFADRLNHAMTQAQRRGQLLAVAYLDLDGFKSINDNHGHEAGDLLLMHISNFMKQTLREGDTLARMGGDEFVAILPDLTSTESSIPMISRLLAAAAQPVPADNLVFQVTASLGVTFYPQAEEVDADQLLRQADQAMYQAKLSGKNRYHFFDAVTDSNLRGHHENLNRIREALSAGEFVLYYQPKVNMRTGTVVGLEALIRWQHPERGLLPPSLFLPVIEDHLLAVEIGNWVIETALSQIDIWRDTGLHIPVSVNVSARQLQHAGFVEGLREALAAHPNVRPSSLELEVLETSALEDIVQVSQIIETCKGIGVEFALDDFGTGYSSLTYLKRLPFTFLKIDQSFVRDMLDDPDDLAILDGVLSLATAFSRQAIAEGVETLEHGNMLLHLGCELAQGYGIAHPMPAANILSWSAAWQPDP